ncbi:DJ-1/PfpI family protein [Williamsia phyllosphaerae]|uniref:AraC family transcriptional regulator n=1 Tax=Williamsia phyllosphaerae TaxID=885042 RepID=A0ABQ1ULG0_9NOCA|nr:DJ-1/PfpI family protein [Williamsia phyllosphaerae]GGF19666.1 AraC family transcriptional regulator [Williamsia phyllosphaerae]
MHRVVALVLPNVVAFDLAIPAQIFGHAAEQEYYSFTTCGVAPGPVPSTTGYAVYAERGIDAIASADTVVVPGYAPHDVPDPVVLDALRTAAGRGARVVSVCTGAFALAAAGLLDGRKATTHWQHTDELAALYPLVDVDGDVLYVDAGQIMTSAGVAAGIDLCLHIVRTDLGADDAVRIARRMVVAPHRDGGQAQYLQRPVPADGTGLAATCDWAREHLEESLTVADMAKHAGWAPRTFARRFLSETGMTPLRWLVAQRRLEARRLLESTDMPVDEVARRSGLGTAGNLRLHLARDADSTPTAYRRTYRNRLRRP